MSEDIQSETPCRLLKSVLAISESSSMLAYSGPYMQDYVRMQHNYVHIRLIYINMQHDYVDMRHNEIFMSTCNMIMSTCDIIMLTCGLNYLVHVCDQNYLAYWHKKVACEHNHMLHVDINYLACRGQKYATIWSRHR